MFDLMQRLVYDILLTITPVTYQADINHNHLTFKNFTSLSKNFTSLSKNFTSLF